MVWLIVLVAMAVLAVAVWDRDGRLGTMPGPVNDRPKGVIPEGPIDEEFLATVQFPRAWWGYSGKQVTSYLKHPEGEPAFDVVRRGYDMQVVDAVIRRLADEQSRTSDAEASHSVVEEQPTAGSQAARS